MSTEAALRIAASAALNPLGATSVSGFAGRAMAAAANNEIATTAIATFVPAVLTGYILPAAIVGTAGSFIYHCFF